MISPPPEDIREVVRCGACELKQFETADMMCRRCKKPLRRGTVERTTVVVVAVPDLTVRPLREAMRRAVVQAVAQCGGPMKAARELGISTDRLKQLLREAGDESDYRRKRVRRAA